MITVCIFRSCGRRPINAPAGRTFPAPEPVWDKIGRAGYRSCSSIPMSPGLQDHAGDGAVRLAVPT